MSLLSSIFGNDTSRFLTEAKGIVAAVNDREVRAQSLSDADFPNETKKLKDRFKVGESLDDLLPEAFALVREASLRTLKQRHYDVQLVGGLALHRRKIAEMRTGEGKTLVATLPAYLNALSEKGVHIITVNDYLARRDAVWMGQVYAFLGLSVAVINGQNQSFLYDPSHIPLQESVEVDRERDAFGSFKIAYEFLRPVSKREAYAADITYGTNSEFGFDYLRDNTVYRKTDLSQRTDEAGGHNFAIIDEIDSILIDEARTPLIISMATKEAENLYQTFARIAGSMTEGEHYEVDEKKRAVTLTDAGVEKAETMLGVENIYTDAGIRYVHHLETAVKARGLYKRDQQYVVREGKIVIVDEFTGRLQPSRRWSDGLHQAIEAKEGVFIQEETRTFASITYQNYFRMYGKLAGMTGTARTSAEEFYKVYGLEVIEIPTNKDIKRLDRNDLIFQTEKGKLEALAKRVKELQERGQPVLIGTVSIEKNEMLALYLKQEGIAYTVLNAKNHEQEGEIIAQAGRKGSVTVATNMAGRGVDIKLGGATASKEEQEAIRELGGLFVIGTERHEARRIDDQLRGRSGRQGDPGETQFYVSLEDSLMRIFASDNVKAMMGRFGIPEDMPIENRLINRSLESAQKKIEGLNFDARKHVLEFDDVLNTQRGSIYGQRRTLLTGDNEHIATIFNDMLEGNADIIDLMEKKRIELGDDAFYESVKRLILQTIDMFWVEHLELMDYTRSSVSLRAYGQRDPLVEYQREGLRLFRDMQAAIRAQVQSLAAQINASGLARDEERLRREREALKMVGGDPATKIAPVHAHDKIGRNDTVKITNGTETKEMKFKKAESLIESGEWKIVS
ncbi:MAG: preprotein translocase subunit SecA [Candidatus Pacebacteria bacterium]|nr:preprotein translocase subunit SecA [Candidatus Paceibacterota bacterium]